MQEELSDRVKIGMLIITSILVIALAVLIYFYQTNQISLSADTVYRAPSTLCITGKMKINGQYQTSKCFYDVSKTKIEAEDDIALQIDENYTLTYIMGDYIYFDNQYIAPYQKCDIVADSSNKYDWVYNPTDFSASLSNVLGIAIDEPIFDPALFVDTSSLTGHKNLEDVDYHDAPISKQGVLTSFKYLNKYGITASGVESTKVQGYDFAFDQLIPCDQSVGIEKDVYYGGAHQPGDFVSVSFNPKITKSEGNIMGYATNESSLTPNLNGNFIKTKYKIVANLDDYYYEAMPVITDLDVNNDGIINYEDENIDATDLDKSVSNLTARISTGSVLWFNIFIAFLIIIIIWYIMFRKRIIN